MADSTGVPSVSNDTGQFDSLLNSTPKAADEAATLNSGTNSAFGNYLSQVKSEQSPLNFYTQVSQSQGIPQMQDTAKTLQGQIYNTEDAIGRIPQDVTGTTGNSLVTQAQRNGIINEKSQPLQDTLTKQSTAYSRVSGDLTTAKADALNLTNLNQQGQQNINDAYKTGITVAQDNAARTMTGFTTDVQNSLNVALQKIARGEQISDENAKMAFDAMQSEKAYQQQVQIAATAQSNKSPNTQIVTSGGVQKLINSDTGAVISVIGPSAASPTPSKNYYQSSTNMPSTAQPTTPQPSYSAKSGVITNGWYSTGNGWIPVVK